MSIFAIRNKLFITANWIQVKQIFFDLSRKFIFNQLLQQLSVFCEVNMGALTNKCTRAHDMQNECSKAGATFRNTPLPTLRTWSPDKDMLHRSALKIHDLAHQQHFSLPSSHTHIIRTPLLPLNCSPEAHQEGQSQLTPASMVSLGFYCSILAVFIVFSHAR